MLFSKIRLIILITLLGLIAGQTLLEAAEQGTEKAETFVKILEGAYQASCDDVERLRDYYLADAEIISDGRLTTLNETIDEMKRSMGSLKGLTCSYRPRVKSSRIGAEIASLVVRESIRLSSPAMEEQQVEQICTYVFLKRDGLRWKIAVDHCSTIPGETA